MATIIGSLPVTLLNGTTADATQVMSDFNFIVSQTNANGAHNGANADITSLSALSTPLSVNQGGIGGTNLAAVGSSLVLIQNQSIAAVASMVFTTGINSSFDTYLLWMTQILPAAGAQQLILQVSQDGGGTYKTGAGNYAWGSAQAGGALAYAGSAADTKIGVGSAFLDNTAGRLGSAFITFSNPSAASVLKNFDYNIRQYNGAQFVWQAGGGAYIADGGAINAIRFTLSGAGNFTTMTGALYGLRAA